MINYNAPAIKEQFYVAVYVCKGNILCFIVSIELIVTVI